MTAGDYETIGDPPLFWLQEEIRSLIAEWVGEKKSENYWREPLVAVASAIDPLLMELRRVVDPEHAMPEDLLPGARAVVVFFLPFQQSPWRGKRSVRVPCGAQLG